MCSGTTGHAEVTLVAFDPKTISYEKLLDLFWKSHDPTSGNRQGLDIGSQYRSCVFAMTDAQFDAAQKSKEALSKSGKLKRPITTEVRKGVKFYMAEEYHQQYVDKHNGLVSCPIPNLKP